MFAPSWAPSCCRRRSWLSFRGCLRSCRSEEAANRVIEMSRFGGDVGSQLPGQFVIAAGGELLCVSRDGGQRVAQLQSHLGRHFSAQLLLAAYARQLSLIVDQAGGAENFCSRRLHCGQRDIEDALFPGGREVVSLHASRGDPFPQGGLDAGGESLLSGVATAQAGVTKQFGDAHTEGGSESEDVPGGGVGLADQSTGGKKQDATREVREDRGADVFRGLGAAALGLLRTLQFTHILLHSLDEGTIGLQQTQLETGGIVINRVFHVEAAIHGG